MQSIKHTLETLQALSKKYSFNLIVPLTLSKNKMELALNWLNIELNTNRPVDKIPFVFVNKFKQELIERTFELKNDSQSTR